MKDYIAEMIKKIDERSKNARVGIQIGEVISEEPNLLILVGELQLDKDDFLINEYLLTSYQRNFITQTGKLDLQKEDLTGIGATDSKHGGVHKHDVLHLEDIITTQNGDHYHDINNQETDSAAAGTDASTAHKHIINGKAVDHAGNHQHKLLNYEPVETDEQEGMSSHSHDVVKLDFEDGEHRAHDGNMVWAKILKKGDKLAVMPTLDEQTYIILCKVVDLNG